MTDIQTASLLRLADSAFPSGAFSQSFGLETAIIDGRVCDEATLAAWLESYLIDGWATLDGAAMLLVMRNFADAGSLDAIVTAASHAPEVRTANARMAAAIFDSLSAMSVTSPALATYRFAVFGGRANGVPALAFALAYAALGIEARDGFLACASSTLTALGGVGTRAIPLGQRATARVLWNARETALNALVEAERIAGPDELCSQALDVELDALTHRLLDGRLFAS
jgi:urease accessory protein